MSYHDIDDWADENIPMDLFDSWEDYITEIEADFARHGHHFPDGMRDTLREHWFNEHGQETPEPSYEEPTEYRAPPRREPEPQPTASRPVIVVRDPERIIIYERDRPARVINVPPDGFKVEVRRTQAEPLKSQSQKGAETAQRFREARARARRGHN